MTKLRFWDRIWSALMGIVCVALAAALVLYAAGWLPVEKIKNAWQLLALNGWQRWGVVAVCALLLTLVGLRGISVLFRRRKDKGFVLQHTEYGDMSISMKAMENMVKRCVDSHSELTVNQTKIYLVRNGVSVDLKLTLAAGVNIPLTVNALQKQIKQYITSCSGVDVHEVRVKVETDAVKLLPAPQTPAIEPAPAEDVKAVELAYEAKPQHVEEPALYVQNTEEPAVAQEQETVLSADETTVISEEKQTVAANEAENDNAENPVVEEMIAEDVSAAEEASADA